MDGEKRGRRGELQGAQDGSRSHVTFLLSLTAKCSKAFSLPFVSNFSPFVLSKTYSNQAFTPTISLNLLLSRFQMTFMLLSSMIIFQSPLYVTYEQRWAHPSRLLVALSSFGFPNPILSQSFYLTGFPSPLNTAGPKAHSWKLFFFF